MWPWKPRPPRSTGQQAEDLAAKYLRRQGFKIIARNVRAGRNEIDLVAQDGATLVIVEVRSRTADDGVPPEDSVGPEKQRRVRRAAEHYVARLQAPPADVRIDVVAVLLVPGEAPRITHFRDAVD